MRHTVITNRKKKNRKVRNKRNINNKRTKEQN